jgi:hypothetical protein
MKEGENTKGTNNKKRKQKKTIKQSKTALNCVKIKI